MKWILTLFLVGCYNQPGMGDGRLVILHRDDAFSSSEVYNLQKGLEVWKDFDLGFAWADEYPHNQAWHDAPHVLVERSGAFLIGTYGVTWPGLNRITIYADYLWNQWGHPEGYEHDPAGAMANTFAHELGHTMGLPHNGVYGDLMNSGVSSSSQLTSDDIDLFCRYYPSNKMCQ